jgi:hypothetical protein
MVPYDYKIKHTHTHTHMHIQTATTTRTWRSRVVRPCQDRGAVRRLGHPGAGGGVAVHVGPKQEGSNGHGALTLHLPVIPIQTLSSAHAARCGCQQMRGR